MTEISNSDDVIDSRDVIARIEELRDEIEEREAEHEGAGAGMVPPELREELAALEALAAEAEDYAPDWCYGETLIRKSYFVTYAQELAEDIGAVKADAPWPNSHIDWEAAARELAIDYTEVDFDGVPYLIR